MTTMKRLTLGDLVQELRNLPDGARVNGLGRSVDSYRGYYERNAIEPEWDNELPALALADMLEDDFGKAIWGWKGGHYHVSADEFVYLANPGDTGPVIIGLEFNPKTGIYEPVLLEEEW